MKHQVSPAFIGAEGLLFARNYDEKAMILRVKTHGFASLSDTPTLGNLLYIGTFVPVTVHSMAMMQRAISAERCHASRWVPAYAGMTAFGSRA